MVDPAFANLLAESAPFLAADIGGTHVRLAIVRSGGTGRPLEVLAFHKYDCTDQATLGDFIIGFLASQPDTKIDRGVVASAGYALDDSTVIASNLPWPLSIPETRERLGFTDLRLVNDFEAVAYAAAALPAAETFRIAGPDEPAAAGPVLVLGPGTGLGAAVWIPRGKRPFVLATEAGQSALAPGNPRELRLLTRMFESQPHVSIEHVLSGPGIRNVYATLCELHGVRAALATPGEITAAAQAGSDPLAREALEIFCEILGSAVGDMAMNYGATGGIRLAGGFLSQIRGFLEQSSFVARFLNKGSMRAALERIPVRLVEHGQLGVLGAANWYLGQYEAG
ncbi:MAG: glucokinase [Pseudoxanthomonas sp.]